MKSFLYSPCIVQQVFFHKAGYSFVIVLFGLGSWGASAPQFFFD